MAERPLTPKQIEFLASMGSVHPGCALLVWPSEDMPRLEALRRRGLVGPGWSPRTGQHDADDCPAITRAGRILLLQLYRDGKVWPDHGDVQREHNVKVMLEWILPGPTDAAIATWESEGGHA